MYLNTDYISGDSVRPVVLNQGAVKWSCQILDFLAIFLEKHTMISTINIKGAAKCFLFKKGAVKQKGLETLA